MTAITIGAEHEPLFDWFAAADAIANGHQWPIAQLRDATITQGSTSLLTRSAWIDGFGMLVKSATVFPDNPAHGKPTVHGIAHLMNATDGSTIASIDFDLLTAWKTAADSMLAARLLAPSDVDSVLLVGAGPMAAALAKAYRELFPDAQISVTARTAESAERFADTRPGVTVARNLPVAVRAADLISVATTSPEPVLEGAWLRTGQHIDLVGGYRADMREADDELVRRGTLFVDARMTTLEHVGDLVQPIQRGVIGTEDVIADFYDLASGRFTRTNDDEVTVFKNGGGGHLDLMIARYFYDVVTSSPPRRSRPNS